MENRLDSGFQIKNIILVESTFSRINHVTLDKETDKIFDINSGASVDGDVITVVVEATVAQKLKDIEEFRINVKMVGIFEHIGETKITNFEEFGKVNGSAIIFPYIREHVASISLKAGIGAIVLPPVNFTKMPKK